MTARIVLCLGAMGFFAAGAFAQETRAAGKAPVPVPATLEMARKLVSETYGKDIAKAKTRDDQSALARKLLQAAGEEQAGGPVRYVLLGLAQDMAIQAAQVDTAVGAADELAGSYAVDALKGKADVLVRLDKARGADPVTLSEQCTRLVAEALAADRYDLARQGAELATGLARKIGDRASIQAAAARLIEVKAIEAGYEQAHKALVTLETDSNNTGAYLAAGRFLCFFKGDWEKGVPMLANSGEKALKTAADREIEKPADPAKQVELADGWWDLARKEEGLVKRNLQSHAVEWYKKAQPGLKGMLKLKADVRLDEWKAQQPAPRSPASREVVILKAAYGVPGVPSQLVDVTASLQKAIPKGPFLVIQPDNRTFGDPAVGRLKRLLVEYRCGETRGKLDLGEAAVAVVPPITLPSWPPGAGRA
ncbi:MAG: hypothetical protein NT031_18595 [Planctomycetota bacterium]|nr:hypothetical protein [Planctomycetota bacterium]